MYPIRLLIPSLLLLKSTLSSWDGQTPLSIPISFVQEFAKVLVTNCLVMRTEELERWNEDPEEFINDEEMDKWEFELRPCAEYVLRSLISGYKEELGPQLAAYLRDPKVSRESPYLSLSKSSY